MARTIEEIMADEETLGGPIPPADSATEPGRTDEPLSAEEFDVASWISGIRPTRRGCTVYSRPDLLAELDILSSRLAIAQAAGDKAAAEALIAQGAEITQDIENSALDIIFEGWSQARSEAFEAQLKADGITDAETKGLHRLAAQCVAPVNATPDLFAAIGENLGAQSLQVLQAFAQANNSGVDVDGPFWQRS